MKVMFIVSAVCVFLSLFWLAYYTYQKCEIENYKESKRNIFLLITSTVIILYCFIALFKISLSTAFFYICDSIFIYIFLLCIIYYKFEKNSNTVGFAFLFAILSIVSLLAILFCNFEEIKEKVSIEEVKLECSDYSTGNILIINLREPYDKINEFCIMKYSNKDMPLEISYNEISSIHMVEKGDEKLEINKVITYSYDLLAHFGFKESVITEDFDYSLYINEDSIKYNIKYK